MANLVKAGFLISAVGREAGFQRLEVFQCAAEALCQQAERAMYDFQFLSPCVVAPHVKFATSVDETACFFNFCFGHDDTHPYLQTNSVAPILIQ